MFTGGLPCEMGDPTSFMSLGKIFGADLQVHGFLLSTDWVGGAGHRTGAFPWPRMCLRALLPAMSLLEKAKALRGVTQKLQIDN